MLSAPSAPNAMQRNSPHLEPLLSGGPSTPASSRRPSGDMAASGVAAMEVSDDPAGFFAGVDPNSFLHVSPLSMSRGERLGLYALLVCMVGLACAYIGYASHKIANGESYATSTTSIEAVDGLPRIRFLIIRPVPASVSGNCTYPAGGALPVPAIGTRMSSLVDGTPWPKPGDTDAPYPASVCMPPNARPESHTDPPGAPPTLIQPQCRSVTCVTTSGPFLPFGWRSSVVRAQVCEIEIGPWVTTTTAFVNLFMPIAWAAGGDAQRACPVSNLRYFAADPEGVPSRAAIETAYISARDVNDNTPLADFVASSDFDRFMMSSGAQIRLGCAASGGIPWEYHWDGPRKFFMAFQPWKPGDPIASSITMQHTLTLDSTTTAMNKMGLSLSYVVRDARIRLQAPVEGFSDPSCDRAYAADWHVTTPANYAYLTPNTTYTVDTLIAMLDVSAEGLVRTEKTRRVLSFTGIDLLVGLMSVIGGMSTLLGVFFPIIQKGESARFFRFGRRKNVYHSLLKKC